MNSDEILHDIQERLRHSDSPISLIEQLVPRTLADAMRWTRRLLLWDEYRGRYSDQAIGLARIISRRAMHDFKLTIAGDGHVQEKPAKAKPRPSSKATLLFSLPIGDDTLRVEYTPGPSSRGEHDLFTFVSPHSPLQSHGLSESGYLAHFAGLDAVQTCGGPEAYARLFAEARLTSREESFVGAFRGHLSEEPPKPRKRSTMPAAELIDGPDTAQAQEMTEPNRECGSEPTPRPTQTFRIVIRGEEIGVDYTPKYFVASDKDHFEFRSLHKPPRANCLGQTGYLSHFIKHDAVMAEGGPEPVAAAYAEARAGELEESKRREMARRPLDRLAEPPPAPPVIGEHTAKLANHELPQPTETPPAPPNQRSLF